MQLLRPPDFPPLCSSFKNHRSSIDHCRYSFDLALPKPVLAPVWASLPTPPMSGSPPPDHFRDIPREPQQIVGRRRRRSETPPPTATTSIASPPLEQTAPRLFAQGRGGQAYSEIGIQQHPYASTYPASQQYVSGTSVPASPIGAPIGQYGSIETSPRATRKTKAHVPSACVNCKKKHLRCDSSRPCRRCVQHGKEDTCVDVEHKKRGRPPLKPDDPSTRRPFESAFNPLSGQSPDQSRALQQGDPYSQGSSFQRSFRPLQAVPPYDQSRSQLRQGPPLPPMYGQPTISASPTMAMGSFVPSPLNYQSSLNLASGLQPGSYLTSITEGIPRTHTGHGERYSYPPPPAMSGQGQMGPPQSFYGNPLFPRTTIPPATQNNPLALSGPSSLQLPPIRPTAPTSSFDPSSTQQQSQIPLETATSRPQVTEGQRTSSDDSTRPRDPKRPKMDIQGILGPKTD